MCNPVTLPYLLILLYETMVCIVLAFSTFILLAYGAVVTSKWLLKTARRNCLNILKAVYSNYNLPEITYQRVKV